MNTPPYVAANTSNIQSLPPRVVAVKFTRAIQLRVAVVSRLRHSFDRKTKPARVGPFEVNAGRYCLGAFTIARRAAEQGEQVDFGPVSPGYRRDNPGFLG